MKVNLFLPQVTRIPVTGPAPYNTLVCVQSVSGGGPGTIIYGKMNRMPAVVSTPFRLMGFDQRVPPVFAHSTTAWLSSMGPAEDSSWLFAVDEVTGAGFSPVDGSYYVTLNLAAMPPAPLPESCFQLAPGYGWCFNWMTIQVTSFVLCYEPPPPEGPLQRTHSLVVRRDEHAGLLPDTPKAGSDLVEWAARKLDLPLIRSTTEPDKKKCPCH